METVTLEREAPRPRGKKKLYVSSMPKRESLQIIQKLQSLIEEINPEFIPYPISRLHMTIFHFGDPISVFNAIQQQKSSSISFQKYQDMLPSLIQTYNVITNKMESSTVTPLELDYFGKYAVLKVRAQQSFIRRREYFNVATQVYLRHFGVYDTDSFCYYSKDLWTASRERYNPHITLGTIEQSSTDISQITGISIPNIDIGMSRPYIVNEYKYEEG
jgi:hypothetical protein